VARRPPAGRRPPGSGRPSAGRDGPPPGPAVPLAPRLPGADRDVPPAPVAPGRARPPAGRRAQSDPDGGLAPVPRRGPPPGDPAAPPPGVPGWAGCRPRGDPPAPGAVLPTSASYAAWISRKRAAEPWLASGWWRLASARYARLTSAADAPGARPRMRCGSGPFVLTCRWDLVGCGGRARLLLRAGAGGGLRTGGDARAGSSRAGGTRPPGGQRTSSPTGTSSNPAIVSAAIRP
jgi:hypothetical protein